LASKTGYSWGGSTSSYNQNYSISDTLVYNSLSLENPGVITITSLNDCETLKDKYILFNNTTYFIPSSATFSETSSGSSFSKTYTLKCSGA
jgi:hypothetical protein